VNRLKKESLHLTDMMQNVLNSWHRRQRSKTYLLLVPLIAIFYMVPSAQMVYAEFERARESGQSVGLLCNVFNSGSRIQLAKKRRGAKLKQGTNRDFYKNIF
jgi:hypothetical protein